MCFFGSEFHGVFLVCFFGLFGFFVCLTACFLGFFFENVFCLVPFCRFFGVLWFFCGGVVFLFGFFLVFW